MNGDTAVSPVRRSRALLGFDGFVDTLHRVVRERRDGAPRAYRSIPEFGAEVTARAGRSGGFELEFVARRPGGNAPLTAGALAALGVEACCVGALGLAGPAAAFAPLAEAGCDLVACGDPGSTTALEFDDGKLMFSDLGVFDRFDFGALRGRLGLERLRGLARGRDLLVLAGWSNLTHAAGLWSGFLEEVLLPERIQGLKCFADLADVSRAGRGQFEEWVGVLRRYRGVGPVALGLNENEALRLAQAWGLPVPAARGDARELAALAGALRGALDLDLVVVHPRRGAAVAWPGGSAAVDGPCIEHPVVSTGGGDHFNAGFCSAWLEGRGPEAAARRGSRVAARFVERGSPPTAEDLAEGWA